MTLPVSGSPVINDYDRLWNAIVTLRSDCLNIKQLTTAGSCSLQWFLQLAQDCRQYNAIYAVCTATPTLSNAIISWAQQQTPGVTFSGTDFTNTNAAVQTMLSTVAAQYPTTGGFLADRHWDPAEGVVWTTVTAAQVPTVLAAIDAFLATLS